MVWSSQPPIRDQEQHVDAGDSLSAFICTFDNWDIVLLWWWAPFFQNTRKHLNLIRKQQNWSSQNWGKRHCLIVLQTNSLLVYTEIYQSKLENAFRVLFKICSPGSRRRWCKRAMLSCRPPWHLRELAAQTFGPNGDWFKRVAKW